MSLAIPQEPGINREVGYGKPPAEHRFKPGNRANPKGRPPGRSLTALLRCVLEADGEEGKNAAERIAERLVQQALRGDISAIKVILDRTEGKPPDHTLARLAEEEPVTVGWEVIMDVVMDALAPFPEARAALGQALSNFAQRCRDGEGTAAGWC